MNDLATIAGSAQRTGIGAGQAPAAPAAAALPRLALRASQIETWNALVSAEGTELRVAGLTVAFRRQPASSGRRFRHALKWLDATSGRTVLVSLQTFPFLESHGADLRAENLDDLPAHLGTALEASALAIVADRLAKTGMKPPAIEAATDVPPAGAIDVVVRIGGLFAGEVALRLCGAPGALASLGGIDGILALARVSPLAEAVRVPFSVRLAEAVLSAGEVASLEIGDAILLDGSPRRSLMLCAMRRRFHIERMQDGWMITEIGMDGDQNPSGARDGMSGAGGRAGETAMPDPAGLPVAVAFELATSEVPIGQLATWTPGALVDIGLADVAAGLPVTVRIGGRQMARGDLVRIDDRFAVRLSAIGPWSNAGGDGS
ncbi:FliM/FliN family flagellar motor switch protein [Aquibium microcysteis]|uniref:FliM/FliN family flagellar motor switch protein n=1 Tax=Aquibium microcysteis TaxID=675281 RepID=UPI00165CFFAA|nr:FliM/FliN family flagellar motor switch protein [Aquibium microcysteis]